MIRLTIIGQLCSRITYIYGLVDPRSGMVRYVGKSDAPQERFRRHLKDAGDTHKSRWMRSIGAPPVLRILAVVRFEEWQMHERAWIARMRAAGCSLTNSTDGGRGPLHPSPETRQRMRSAKVGRRLSEQHRAKVSAALLGVAKPARSAEHIAKIAAAKRGKPLSEKQCAALAASRYLRGANSSSGFKGVSFDKARGLFKAHITIDGRWRFLGRFHTAEEAARVYNGAARAHGWPPEGLNPL